MSATIMGDIFYLEMDARRKLVLLVLADHVREDGHCWPSQVLIALKASISERKCRDHLSALRQSGWLNVIPGRGRGLVNHYYLNVKRISRAAANRKEVVDLEKASHHNVIHDGEAFVDADVTFGVGPTNGSVKSGSWRHS